MKGINNNRSHKHIPKPQIQILMNIAITANPRKLSPKINETTYTGIGKATRHAQLALPSRLWRIEVRYLCAHVRPVNSD